MDIKTCTTCGHDKPRSEFKHSKSWCADCWSKYIVEWRQRPGVKDRQRWHRFRARLAQYGLEPVDYMRMLDAQNGVCAICRQSCKTGRDLAVDHCHSTGVARGLLCTACNLLVGDRETGRRAMADDRAALADRYLTEYGRGNPALNEGVGLGPLPSRRRVRIEKPKNPDWFAKKLSREQVADIRRRVEGGESRKAIARELGVASSTISRIASGRMWSNVP